MQAPRTVTSYWSFVDSEQDNSLDIHIGGLDPQEQTVHVIVKNFTPYVYVELPTLAGGWSACAARMLYDYFSKIMQPLQLGSYDVCQKRKLHYLEEAYFLRILMPTHAAGRKLGWAAPPIYGSWIGGVRPARLHRARAQH